MSTSIKLQTLKQYHFDVITLYNKIKNNILYYSLMDCKGFWLGLWKIYLFGY